MRSLSGSEGALPPLLAAVCQQSTKCLFVGPPPCANQASHSQAAFEQGPHLSDLQKSGLPV